MKGSLTSTRGGPLRLGRELGRGGEGSVFEVADYRDFVAKIYHSSPDREKAEKLVTMASGSTDRLLNISAWPIDTIHDITDGAVRGFVMKRVARQKDIHVLYGPKTRLRDYPDATYRFLVHVATNVARAFAVVHDHGHVIGDVNQGGVCVSTQGTITLVDCDSFQVRGEHRTFSCDVGIPIYQPPELQHVRSFRGLSRTTNHDCFGLAVLIFQTLFLARHPFSGAFQGNDDMPIERAIREFRFAYGRDAARRQMKQPPGTIGLGAVPSIVATLFERAFLEDGVRNARPTALEWVTALDGFLAELKECSRNPGHAYIRTLTTCPLCEIEGRVGVLLFVPPARQGTVQVPAIDIEALWSELIPIIASAHLPDPSHSHPLAPTVPAEIIRFKQAKSRASRLRWLGITTSIGLAALVHPIAFIGTVAFPLAAWMTEERKPDAAKDIDARLLAAERRLNAILQHIEQERRTSPLPGLAEQADKLYRSLLGFPQRRAESLRNLERSRHQRQLQRFLDRFEVKDAQLKGFGAGLIATLVSNGVETADDITVQRLERIRGFGPKRISALLDWRRSVETGFRINPSDPADVQERSRVETQLQVEYAKEIRELQRLAEQIKACADPLRQRIVLLTSEHEQAQQEVTALRAIADVLTGTI